MLMRVVSGLLAGGVLWSGGQAAAQTTLERIQQEDVLRVGVAGEAPYGYVEDGQLKGEAPTILRHIVQNIDPAIRLEPVVTEFQNLIPELQAGRFDVIAAGMYIAPGRCEQVAFTRPTYKIGEALLVQAGNPKNLTDFNSIAQQADARLAVLAGAMEYSYAYDAGVFVDQVMLVPDYPAGLSKLKAGEIDAIAMTALTARTLAAQDDALAAGPQFFPATEDGEPVAGYGAFALRQADTDLLAALNGQLAAFIGSAEHWQLVAPFGFTPEMEPDVTVAALCGDED